MKDTIAFLILTVLAGCSLQAPPKQAVLLPPGTKIISPVFSEIRDTFRDRTDYWRSGSVVELSEPLALTTPD